MKRTVVTYCVILVVTGIISISSCKREVAEDFCKPPEAISYRDHVQPIFDANCVECHSGTSPDGGLNLEPDFLYAELLQPGKGYVDTLYPKYSLLYSQMTSTTNPMPPNGRLSKCSTDIILRWIEQQAKNN